ncbi:MAG: hypothetical protein WDZ80_03840 [Candidatus Paceibacterota bacterium]
MFSEKELHELSNYLKYRAAGKMSETLVKSNGFDIEKLFIEKTPVIDDISPIFYVSTKKKSKTKQQSGSDIEATKLIEEIKKSVKIEKEAREANELSDEEIKEFSDYYKDSDIDLSEYEYMNLIDFERYYMEGDHKFQYKRSIEIEFYDEFRNSEDINLLENEFLGVYTVEPDYNYELRLKYLDNEDNTGYIIPLYNHISDSVSSSDIIQKYESVVADFKLDHSKKVSIVDVVNITQFRDLLYNQVERQLKVIDSLNENVKKYLKFFYRQLELQLLEHNKTQNPKTYKNEILEDWYYFVGMVRSINRTFVYNKLDDKELNSHLQKIKRIPVISTELNEKTCLLLKRTHQKKAPILNIARDLLIKIRCAESIIEDILMEQTLKPPKDFVEWFKSHSKVAEQEKITNKDIICKAVELRRQGYSVSHMFNKMREWLLDEDKKFGEKEFKKKYGFGISNMGSFNKHVNNHKNLCPPENN